MAYGLLIRNASGDTIIDTTSNIVNAETLATTTIVVAANSSTSVTVPDVHIPEAVVFDLIGGDEDITTTTSTDTLTVINGTGAQRTFFLETWRLL
jgi:hypothetical protein